MSKSRSGDSINIPIEFISEAKEENNSPAENEDRSAKTRNKSEEDDKTVVKESTPEIFIFGRSEFACFCE